MPNEHHRNSQLIRAGRTTLAAILALSSLLLLVLTGLPPAPIRSAHADPPTPAKPSAPRAETKDAPITSTQGAPPPRPSIPLDFNNDGVLDTVRREMRSSDTAPLYSRFVVLSGAGGAELASFSGPQPNDLFGWIVATPGDLDADGVEDFYVGTPDSPVGQPLMDTWGRVYFVSGSTGAITELFAASDRGVIGLGIVPLWDEDDDGLVDLAVGGLSPIETPQGADPGSGGVSANDEDPANPTIVLAHTQWWILSSASGDTLQSGYGRPPQRLLNSGENGASFWASGAIAGERIWLDGVAGDLDGDGEVGMRDVTMLLQRMSESRDGAARLDLDGDGRLDASDLGVLLQHFGDRRGRNPRLPRGTGLPVSFMGDGSGCGRNCHMECVDSDDCVNGGGGGPPGGGGGPPDGCSGGPNCAPGCDGNGNGVPDSQECGTPCYAGGSPDCDTDGDGTPDNQDCDSGGSNPCCQDSDGDGTKDQNEDDDCDGIPNGRDCDSPCFAGDSAACGDDDEDGIKNQDDPDSPQFEGVPLLRIDSNNDGRLTNDDDQDENALGAMKVLIVNRDDADEDDIPNYADGFGMFGPDSVSGVPADRFAELKIHPGNETGTRLVLIYNDAPLDELYDEQVPVEDIESSYVRYHRGPGLLRLWRTGADAARTEADFVPSGEELSTESLDCELTLYVEAVNGRPRSTRITALIVNANDDVVNSQTVRVLPFDGRLGLLESQIQGYTILPSGSVTGTPGNDIIFAPGGASVIDAGPGDDIIVAPEGDHTILAGSGSDVVFASLVGEKVIQLEELDEARPRNAQARQQQGAQQVFPLEDRPFTTEELLRAYRLIYGEDDPWLTLYLQHNGRVEAVEGDGNPLTQIDTDCWTTDSNLPRPVIQVQVNFENPFIAAPYLRRELLRACGATYPCGLRDKVQADLVDQLFTAALRQEHEEFGELTDSYIELYHIAFNDAVATTALIANIYLSSVGFFSDGADMVLALSDVTDGQYASAAAFLPFISGPMINSYRLVLRNIDGTEIVRKVGEVVHHFPEGVSDIGWVVRRNVELDVGPLVNGNRTWLVGTPQASTLEHAEQCRLLGNQAAAVGDAEYVVYNRSLHTSTAIDKNSLVVTIDGQVVNVSGWRPDVLVVRRGPDGKPKIDLYEVQSPPPGQEAAEMAVKLQRMMAALPSEIRGQWRVIEYPYPVLP